MSKFTVKESYLELTIGETVYPCKKYDYGSAQADAEMLEKTWILRTSGY